MNNSNKNKSHSMMWMMIPCLLLAGFLFWGGGRLPSSGFGYIWLILIGAFILWHVWMMFKGHGGHGSEDEDINK